MKNILLKIVVLELSFLILSSCKKFVEIDSPTTSISTTDVYNNDATAIGALTTLYANLGLANILSDSEPSSLSCIAGLSADELTLYTGQTNFTLQSYYQNSLIANSYSGYWATMYARLYGVNSALEGLDSSTKLSPGVKRQLLGEAKFMRAFYYFYLVNLYGDVPLVFSTDYTVNAVIGKSPKLEVYKKIIDDLQEAQSLLSSQYLKEDLLTSYPTGSEERVRPTKWAAKALLARTYLYLKDWANAEIQSTMVIENTNLYEMESVDKAFLKNNQEAIWQIQSAYPGKNTQEAIAFLPPPSGPFNNLTVYLSEKLIHGFEQNDKRRVNWISSRSINGVVYLFPFKYKNNTYPASSITEYSSVMRLAEQYLIRSEARAELGNLSGGISDIDVVRKRAGISLIKEVNPGIKKDGLLAVISKERQVELFTEWGHRWLDLKRTGKIDEVMSTVTPEKSKGGKWRSFQQYFPISSGELKANPNLSQTTGY